MGALKLEAREGSAFCANALDFAKFLMSPIPSAWCHRQRHRRVPCGVMTLRGHRNDLPVNQKTKPIGCSHKAMLSDRVRRRCVKLAAMDDTDADMRSSANPLRWHQHMHRDFRRHGPRRVSACKLLSKMRGLGGHGLSMWDVQGCAASKSLRLILRSTQNSALIQDTHSRAASEQIHLLNRASPVEA